ncbi:MAG: MFS transporter, partial [Myxococcota bacterium]
TAFGGPYFSNVLVGDGGLDLFGANIGKTTAWGLAISISMICVTLTAPITGAVADRSGKKRPLLLAYVILGVIATAALGLVPPGAGLTAFLLYIVANFAFEGAYVFYNAFLPELAPPEQLGRLSGYGWALGYIGGLLALVVCLPLVPSEYTAAERGAASNIYYVVAVWYAVFSIPAFVFLRDKGGGDRPEEGYVLASIRQLIGTLKAIKTFRYVVIFLIAYFLYNDAITTVIEFVGVFTKEVLQFTPGDNIVLFLVLNVIAAPGAMLFGFLLDRIGGKRALMITLVLWVFVVIGAALTQTKGAFWGVAALAAVVIGATQSSSRALMARLAPRKRVGEFMGFLALSGKASAVLGPAIYGIVAENAAPEDDPGMGHRIAIVVIGSFFLIALGVLSRLNERAGMERAREEDER